MTDFKYEYKRPDGELHIISSSKWRKHFNTGGRSFTTCVEVYVNPDVIHVQYVPSKIGMTLFTLFLPFIFLLSLLDAGVKETVYEIKRQFTWRESGAFSSDIIWRRNSESWGKVMKLIGKQEEN